VILSRTTALFTDLLIGATERRAKSQGNELVAAAALLHQKNRQNGAVETPKETVHGMNPQGDRG
jgi:hypothetical protein